MRGFVPFRGRKIEVGRKYKAYWNLHKDVWSLKAVDGPYKGLVVGHVAEAALADVRFLVSEAGRLRCIAEKRKNVHAYACGVLLPDLRAPGAKLTYNPYAGPDFRYQESGEPVAELPAVLLGWEEDADGNLKGRAYAA